MVKKGQLEVSKMDSPRQGQDRDPDAPKIHHRTASGGTAKVKRSHGSRSQSRARGQSEGSQG
jgi:hypothetical protein